ncbi:MAG: Uma2 family endonuclease [Planctomycetes bacterium]|nr:Uma2 family endonuclease [Planctomycetota bacterium]
MSQIPEHILEWRRQTDAGRRDEVWEGVLHMAPDPTIPHQELGGELLHWLKLHWARGQSRRVLTEVDVSRPGIPNWTKDFRCPDLVVLTGDDRAIDRVTHFEGGPSVVIEIRSPSDESYDKLPFYAAIGCKEIWIVDRDSRASEIYAVDDGEAVRKPADADGWLASCIGVELRTESRKLEIRLAGDDASRAALP